METQTFIDTDWLKLTTAFSENNELIQQLWQELEDKYSSEDRYYHNLYHIRHMLRLCGKYEQALQNPDLVRFAIFYHDAIYSGSRNDNEQKSAALASERLALLGLSRAGITKVESMILSTKTHHSDGNPDTNWLLDFDLAILGASPEAYARYAQQIRQEYSIFPDILYKLGRRKVLEYFLNQPQIFNAEQFQEQFEQQARENLRWELQSIS